MKYFESEIVNLPFECPLCSNVYKNNGGLFSHLKKSHSNANPQRPISSGRPKKMTIEEKNDIFFIFGLDSSKTSDVKVHQQWLKSNFIYLDNYRPILNSKQLELAKKEVHKLSRLYPYFENEKQAKFISSNYVSVFIKVCFQVDPITQIDSTVQLQLTNSIGKYNSIITKNDDNLDESKTNHTSMISNEDLFMFDINYQNNQQSNDLFNSFSIN